MARAAKRLDVDTYKHDAKRANIPTEELREFAHHPESPQTLRWPRDTSLDP